MLRVQTYSWLALFITLGLVLGTTAKLRCIKCSGIGCQRTTSSKSETCDDELDVCVSIFQAQTTIVQGCWNAISKEIRDLCDKDPKVECNKCFEDQCNNQGSKSYQCVQCDSDKNAECRSNSDALEALRCPVARTENAYCFTRVENGRTVRGCSTTAKDQKSCLEDKNCTLWLPGLMNLRMVSENDDPIITSSAARIAFSLSLAVTFVCSFFFL